MTEPTGFRFYRRRSFKAEFEAMNTTAVIQAQHSETSQAPNVPVPNKSLNKSVDSHCQGLRRTVSKAIQHDTDAEGIVPRPPKISWVTLTHGALCEPHMLLFRTNLDTVLGEQTHIRREENRT